MDFHPDFSDDFKPKKDEIIEADTSYVVNKMENAPSFVVEQTPQNKDMLSMGGLLGLTKSHIEEDFQCRSVIKKIEDTLDDNYHVMGIKDLLEYLKIKQREREFHVDCVFKAYAIMQRTDMAKEYMAGSNRKERIIEATDKSKLNFLLSKLNPNTVEEND